MAAIVPHTVNGKLMFFTTHAPKWAEDPSSIGTTAEHVEDVQEKLDAAKAALAEQRQAIQAARNATLRLKSALAALDSAGGRVIGEIKAKARVDGTPVYVRALLRPRKSPTPMGKPGTPTRLDHDLLPGGSLALSWKCKHPRGAKGTMYHVYRAMGINGEPVFLGTTGKKKFTDATLPSGVRTVCYRIVAIRSTARGETAEFLVNVGTSGKVPAQLLPRDQYNAAA